ncbi:glycosyltransferase [Tritonibacter mobilis]|uniref:glycosyltransferase n=1 Tax=Tritonibacter mobilis TaxID=379347 RepID=UPI001C082337|nr:glycosyltransferase [Tritonibacter mobilis]MBU3036176.1 glycosyltransferase [Tritonibacter mobilis]WHQ82933.1 glycosyltransferase [Tritonibacter mobilis]
MRTAAVGHLFIYAPVPVYRDADALYVERQAVNGLRLWSRHFARVTVVMPEKNADVPKGWMPLAEALSELPDVRVETVPSAFSPQHFLRVWPRERRRLKALVAEADYLSFAIGGLFGDWGAVCALEALRLRKRFAIWTDRVESDVLLKSREWGDWKQRLKSRLYRRPMAWLERTLISRADLGLFHGKETYDAYAGFSRNPQLVHDIHIAGADHISDQALQVKLSELRQRPLRIVYAGRAEGMKGPADWISVLERLSVLNVPFEAEWLGDGSCLPMMRNRIRRAGLCDQARFPGFVENHADVRARLQRADVFLFCHKTAESPRCLIEALTSATPIVGYEGAYARDLIAGSGGGLLVPQGDTERLAQTLAVLSDERETLAMLMRRAHMEAAPFTDEKVFAHRCMLIRRYLAPTSRTSGRGPGGRALRVAAEG